MRCSRRRDYEPSSRLKGRARIYQSKKIYTKCQQGPKGSLTGTLAADEATDHPMDGAELGELTVLGVGVIQMVSTGCPAGDLMDLPQDDC